MHTESRLLASELLIKRGVLWDQMEDQVEAFHLNLSTTTYR